MYQIKKQNNIWRLQVSRHSKTCMSAIKAVDLKLNYITIHISSGLNAIRAAKKVAGSIKVIGSLYSSLDNKSIKEIGFDKKIDKLVLRQAKLAAKAKLDAIVLILTK